jgi:SRSO17 transposase
MLYETYLQVSSVRYSSLALSEVAPYDLSHDSISYWLKNSNCKPSEVWQKVKHIVRDRPGTLIFDDTILDKSRSKKIELVNTQYSGNAHGLVNDIGIVNAVWKDTDSNEYVPIDFRIYNKDSDRKTKNDHFREMLKQAITRGVNFSIVVFDTWYSSLNNLKACRDVGKIWVAGLKANRKVNKNETLRDIDIPDEGKELHLRGYGWIIVFKFVAPNGRIDYIGTNMKNPTRNEVEVIVKARWSVEVYHRELKQTCGVERCQSRTERAQRNHICLSVLAWIRQHLRRRDTGDTLYQQCWEVVKDTISNQLKALLPA